MAAPLVLASGSPRRADLLREAGIPFEIVVPDVDETHHAGETPEAYVMRLAAAKAGRVAQAHPDRLVIGADTTVVLDGAVIGKPRDGADAARMLTVLSGRTHTVLTAIGLAGPAMDGSEEAPVVRTRVASTQVEFIQLSADDVAWYVASGEPMDKAGAYAIQGLGGRFVKGIVGSHSNVVGLPLELLLAMCSELGIQVS